MKAFCREQVCGASAERADEHETAAGYEVEAALREALFGNMTEARHRIESLSAESMGRDEQYGVALEQALTGDSVRARALADELGKRFPEDTVVRYNYLPTLNAQLALTQKDASNAVATLQNAAPYELGYVGNLSLCPIYVRGEAYLAVHQGTEAAAEFQKILDHRGIVLNSPISALAHLQIGRAYAMQGDTGKGQGGLSGFPHALERRRPRHSHLHRCESGVRKAAVTYGAAAFPKARQSDLPNVPVKTLLR